MNKLFCPPYENGIQLMESYKKHLSEINNFNPDLNFIFPDESRKFAKLSVLARVQILNRVYAGEYHTDSFDFKRLAQRMETGEESIWFWGSKSEIERLRSSFNSHSEVPPKNLNLGTVSILTAEEEFGVGVAELCRSGSMDFEVGAKPSSLLRTLTYMDASDSLHHERYHTLTFVPRARASTESIRGGEAVNRLHSNYIKSRIMGFAPWYVMQGGNLEQLEFRELHREPEDVKNGIINSGKWFFYNELEAQFARAICKMNYSVAPNIEILKESVKNNNSIENLSACILKLKSEKLLPFNHTTLICESQSNRTVNFKAFSEEILLNWLNLDTSCHVVRLRIDEIDTLPLQTRLANLGFRLTSISAPKLTWIFKNGIRAKIKVPPYGYWSKPNQKWPIVQPFYFNGLNDYESFSESEKIVLNYLKQKLNFGSAN